MKVIIFVLMNNTYFFNYFIYQMENKTGKIYNFDKNRKTLMVKDFRWLSSVFIAAPAFTNWDFTCDAITVDPV